MGYRCSIVQSICACHGGTQTTSHLKLLNTQPTPHKTHPSTPCQVEAKPPSHPPSPPKVHPSNPQPPTTPNPFPKKSPNKKKQQLTKTLSLQCTAALPAPCTIMQQTLHASSILQKWCVCVCVLVEPSQFLSQTNQMCRKCCDMICWTNVQKPQTSIFIHSRNDVFNQNHFCYFQSNQNCCILV